jgi:hypothetical protein
MWMNEEPLAIGLWLFAFSLGYTRNRQTHKLSTYWLLLLVINSNSAMNRASAQATCYLPLVLINGLK